MSETIDDKIRPVPNIVIVKKGKFSFEKITNRDELLAYCISHGHQDEVNSFSAVESAKSAVPLKKQHVNVMCKYCGSHYQRPLTKEEVSVVKIYLNQASKQI